MRLLLAALIVTVPSLAAAQPPASIQEVLLRAKPAVALVVTEVSADVTVACRAGDVQRVSTAPYRESGTGWFINPSGWMLTTAHVVSAAHQPPRWLVQQQTEQGVRSACLPALLRQRGLEPGQRPDVEEQLGRQLLVAALPTARTTLAPSVSVILSNGFRLGAKVAKYSPPVAGEAMSGQDLALLRLEAADMPTLSLGDSAAAKLGDPLHIIGFPNVVMSHELLNASAKVEASITSGAISGFRQDVRNQSLIQTDAAAAAGASGSPAVGSTGAVLGMLSFVTSDEGAVVQGFNFVTPASAIREFLRGTGVALDEPSRFNAAWHAGLAEYFAGRYSRADVALREANRLLPELPDVKRVMTENAERKKAEPLLPWRWVGSGLIAVAALGAAARWALGRRRNRFRIAPSEVARLMETAVEPPVILDVRDDTAYASSPVRIPRSLHVTMDQLAGGTPPPVDLARTVVAYCT